MSDLRDDRTGYSIDDDPPSLSEMSLTTLLYLHREDALSCGDHIPEPDRKVWCCVCGSHDLLVSWREHVAAAIEEWVQPRLAAAWDEGDDHGYGSGHDGVGTGLNPYADHMCACGHPSLRGHIHGICRLCSCGDIG